MKAKEHKSSIYLILGSLWAAFSIIGGGCAKVDHYTKTEWTFMNGTDKTVEVSSAAYPDDTENHFVLMAGKSETIPLDVPVDRKVFTVSESMAPFSYQGAIIKYDGTSYRLPGLFDGVSQDKLPSLCNALNYQCEKKDRIYVFTFIMDEAFISAIQDYRL